jgi:hypothetical protein
MTPTPATTTAKTTRRISATRAAELGGCTPPTILRMVKAGQLAGGSSVGVGGKLPRYFVTATKDEIREALAAFRPTSGYHKPHAKHSTHPAKRINGHSDRLATVLTLARYDRETIEALATLAALFTLAELKVLATLSDKKGGGR